MPSYWGGSTLSYGADLEKNSLTNINFTFKLTLHLNYTY